MLTLRFLDLPDYVSVRPGNGFGYILPSETIDIEIIFCATKAGEFKFNLVLQTLRNFRKVIECTATGAHPPLRLSKQFLNFATPLHDTHRNRIYKKIHLASKISQSILYDFNHKTKILITG